MEYNWKEDESLICLAKELEIKNWHPSVGELKTTLYLCVYTDDIDVMNNMVSQYPIKGYDEYMRFEGKEFKVLCEISYRAAKKLEDGSILDPNKLFWQDPKALMPSGSRSSFFPFERYLFEKTPGWVSNDISVKIPMEVIL